MRTPSGAVSTYQQLHDSFTHITQQEANAATPVPDIAPAAALQSIYPLSYRHNTGCGFPDSPCECILDNNPLQLERKDTFVLNILLCLTLLEMLMDIHCYIGILTDNNIPNFSFGLL